MFELFTSPDPDIIATKWHLFLLKHYAERLWENVNILQQLKLMLNNIQFPIPRIGSEKIPIVTAETENGTSFQLCIMQKITLKEIFNDVLILWRDFFTCYSIHLKDSHLSDYTERFHLSQWIWKSKNCHQCPGCSQEVTWRKFPFYPFPVKFKNC